VRIDYVSQGSKGIATSLYAEHEKFEISNELSSSGFTVYVLRLDTSASDVSGEASIYYWGPNVSENFTIDKASQVKY